ncbi:MAG: sulfite reductase subunit alpha [Gammaproteobacteria bacterium]|nr:sulfite reductase subunit alpha [Gammaproteobacteria bacterium]
MSAQPDFNAPLELIPESAPFSPEQRAWLNGFFSGYLGIDGNTAPGLEDAPALPAEEEEDFPWHDDTMPIDERMQLAEEKPYRLKLMAAMGQQDCGQCGYLCKTYAEAISSGTESDLTLCAPGGRETRKMLKTLVAEGPGEEIAVQTKTATAAGEYSRNHPYEASLISKTPLHKEGSIKETWHVAIELADTRINYHPGDALGIFPVNSAELVDAILGILNASVDESVSINGKSLGIKDALLEHLDITKPSDEVIEFLASQASDDGEREALNRMAAEGAEEGVDLLDILEEFPSARPDPAEMAGCLGKLQPRLYSIASSPNLHKDEVHLTVGAVRYRRKNRARKGVASTFFADNMQAGDKLKVYVQPTFDFRLPRDGDTPIIMIGPGTGIAPFIAFLQERMMLGHKGKNWVFFGNPHSKTDFFYEEELRKYRKDGLLTRLDTAFSRDQRDKIYVQHRMLHNSHELWQWIHEEHASIYVCGDATRMARDVDDTLHRIAVQTHGLSEEAARDYIRELARSGRYLRDVY